MKWRVMVGLYKRAAFYLYYFYVHAWQVSWSDMPSFTKTELVNRDRESVCVFAK